MDAGSIARAVSARSWPSSERIRSVSSLKISAVRAS